MSAESIDVDGYTKLQERWVEDQPLAQLLARGHYPGYETAPMMAGYEMNQYMAWTEERGWMAWSGSVWHSISDERAAGILGRELQRLWRHVNGRIQVSRENVAYWQKLLSAVKARNVLYFLRNELYTSDNKFDAHPDFLNAKNGVVDLKTGELLPHEAHYRFSKITRVDYIPGATHPDWDTAL